MTREETQKLLAVIASLYPNFNAQVKDVSATVTAWAWALEDEDYHVINASLKAFVKMNGSAFAPSAAELIALKHKPQELQEMDALNAWALVSKAVTRSGYYAEEEFNKLPEIVQTAVGSAGQLRAWALGDAAALETVIASNFIKTYNTVVKRQREIERMPDGLKTITARTAALINKGI